MVYLLSNDFTKISETTGTVQNTSHIYTIEMAQSNVKDSGIFIYPLHQHSFNGTDIYLRCVDGAGAEARVVPFEVDLKGGGGSSTIIVEDGELPVATDADIENLLNSILGGN